MKEQFLFKTFQLFVFNNSLSEQRKTKFSCSFVLICRTVEGDITSHDICDYCCFQVVIKTHEKQTCRREASQFFLKHTLAVHFVKTLFQYHICDYYGFQVIMKTHEKETWRRETPQFFLKHKLAVHFVKKLFQCDICYYCCFQVIMKTHEKNKHGREKPHSFSYNTHLLFIL